MTVQTATVTRPRTPVRTLLKVGVVSGVAAGTANTLLVVVAAAFGISRDIAGEPIPIYGFAELTVVGALIGVAIAAVLARRAAAPRRTFVRVTAVLTVLSLVPDVLVADAAASTRGMLMLTHLLAAAIVVPALAARLPE